MAAASAHPSSALRPRPGDAQPVLAGVVLALVGFASSFAIVLAGLRAVGASPVQAASGLLVLCVVMGTLSVALSVRTRTPVAIAWSTPGAALLISAGAVRGGWPAAVGAFCLAGALMLAAAASGRFARAIAGIPGPLASALLAGVLLPVCLAPARSLVAFPALTAPVVAVWLLLGRVARPWAVPGALAAAAAAVALDPVRDRGPGAPLLPGVSAVVPAFDLGTLVGVGLPLFVVTMASQNVAGLSVLASHGFRPPLRGVLAATGAGSVLGAPFGAHAVNLAAITAAMAAGPDAHPDPGRRWVAAATSGAVYLVLGLGAGLSTLLLAASPPVLVEAVAGLALLGTLGGALAAATAEEETRIPAMVTLVTGVSGITVAGVSAPFWALAAGLVTLVALRPRRAG